MALTSVAIPAYRVEAYLAHRPRVLGHERRIARGRPRAYFLQVFVQRERVAG